jgi:hypothetical protein
MIRKKILIKKTLHFEVFFLLKRKARKSKKLDYLAFI